MNLVGAGLVRRCPPGQSRGYKSADTSRGYKSRISRGYESRISRGSEPRIRAWLVAPAPWDHLSDGR